MLMLDVTPTHIGGYQIKSNVNLAAGTVTLSVVFRTPSRNPPAGKRFVYESEVSFSATAATPTEAVAVLKKKMETHLSKLTKAGVPWPSRNAGQYLQLANFKPLPISLEQSEQQPGPQRIYAN